MIIMITNVVINLQSWFVLAVSVCFLSLARYLVAISRNLFSVYEFFKFAQWFGCHYFVHRLHRCPFLPHAIWPVCTKQFSINYSAILLSISIIIMYNVCCFVPPECRSVDSVLYDRIHSIASICFASSNVNIHSKARFSRFSSIVDNRNKCFLPNKCCSEEILKWEF